MLCWRTGRCVATVAQYQMLGLLFQLLGNPLFQGREHLWRAWPRGRRRTQSAAGAESFPFAAASVPPAPKRVLGASLHTFGMPAGFLAGYSRPIQANTAWDADAMSPGEQLPTRCANKIKNAAAHREQQAFVQAPAKECQAPAPLHFLIGATHRLNVSTSSWNTDPSLATE